MIKIIVFISFFIGLASPIFSMMKGSLETLINTWDNSRNICETSTDETQKAKHCDLMEEASKALDSKGFCKGMHTLRFEEDPSKDDPALKDEYAIFEILYVHRETTCFL